MELVVFLFILFLIWPRGERKRRGGFKAAEDLLDVKGIGDTGLQRMKPFVAMTGKTTARIE